MKAIFDVIDGVGLTFTCPDCGTDLSTSDEDIAVAVHPTHDGNAFFGDGERIDCPNAGAKFKRPTMQLERVLAILLLCPLLLTGCASFKEKYKEASWTPDSFNYTLQRDRDSDSYSDYFGLSWSLK